MALLTRDETTKHFRKLVRDAFDEATASIPNPETPEQMATFDRDRELVRQELIDSIIKIVINAYDIIPVPWTEQSSPRTAAIESVIHEMSLKLIEHPSTPYSANAAETLATMLTALDRSMALDARLTT